jgi:acetyl-CoA carboxylase carboxyltransferase component
LATTDRYPADSRAPEREFGEEHHQYVEPDAHLARIKERLNRLRSPFRSAEYFEIEEIIDPRETREHLCRWAVLARRSLRPVPPAFWYRA